LADVDLIVAVGGDGTVLSAAHFLDHGTIPLLGINSDPMISKDDRSVTKKSDERRSVQNSLNSSNSNSSLFPNLHAHLRSHGALCMCTAVNMAEGIAAVLYGGGKLGLRTRIHCTVKSTFSETRLVPALNDLLIANPSPAAVSRFRMGWLESLQVDKNKPTPSSQYGTVTRFGGLPYDVKNSINVWSSGMWVCTATGSTAAMAAAGGKIMDLHSSDLQYLIREHMIENTGGNENMRTMDNAMLVTGQKMHLRWNSQKGRIFIDGSHLTHNLELGDEILIDNNAPPMQMFERLDLS
jgi:NAD+ kinase